MRRETCAMLGILLETPTDPCGTQNAEQLLFTATMCVGHYFAISYVSYYRLIGGVFTYCLSFSEEYLAIMKCTIWLPSGKSRNF